MNYLIITLLVLSFFIYPAYAFSYEEGVGILNDNGTLYDRGGGGFYEVYNSNFTALKPSCQIVPIIDKKIISSGDNFSISFLLPCKGKIESSQLNIYFPEGFLSNENKSYFSQFLANGENETVAVWFNEKPTIDYVSKGATIDINPVYFMEVFPHKRITYGEVYSPRGHPPILFSAYSNEDIDPGDYTIKVIFQYTDGKEWYSSYEEVDIHVKEMYETTEGLIIISIIGSILLAFILNTGKIFTKVMKRLDLNHRFYKATSFLKTTIEKFRVLLIRKI